VEISWQVLKMSFESFDTALSIQFEAWNATKSSQVIRHGSMALQSSILETDSVSETSDCDSILTQLIIQADFIAMSMPYTISYQRHSEFPGMLKVV
jgi:hypothetical protein